MMQEIRERSGEVRLVVGLGASEAGSAGLGQLLAALPAGRGTAILVRALDEGVTIPGNWASLAGMAVLDAEPGDEVRADTVYIGQGAAPLAVSGGRIERGIRASDRGRQPLDHLFHSLVEEYGSRAVGIVLSGDGRDGIEGLREIKAAGGLTIARKPDDAGQAALLRGAIEAGGIDLVLRIPEIPAALERFQTWPQAIADAPDPTGPGQHGRVPNELSESEVSRLAALLLPQLSLDLRVYKAGTVERRVLRRVVLSGFREVEPYLDHLAESVAERRILGRDLLIGVTDFFRDMQAFRALRTVVIDPLVGAAPVGSTLRVWVPACATGEEAYSIGMHFLDAIDVQKKRVSIQIFATDVDQEALAVGRLGMYPRSTAGHVPAHYLERYLRAHDGGYRVRSRLRDMVSFAAHDLTRDPAFSHMHLASCRNVLIYLRPDVQKHVLRVLHFALEPDGFLFLSTSESAGMHRELFAGVSKAWRIYRKIGTSRPVTIFRSRWRHAHERSLAAGLGTQTDPLSRTSPVGNDLARRAVLQARVPPTIIVSEDSSIVFMHGELRPYLRFPEGERPRLDLTSLVTPELATRTRSALFKCRRDGVTVVALSSPDSARAGRVRITASPAPEIGRGAVILTFEDVATDVDEETTAASGAADESAIRELEAELDATRGDLRNTVEELENSYEKLRTSNEEAMSINEELQTANEELEATTEELRSLNEELTTLNAQLREKVEQLEQAHDDLNNFVSSAKIATVFLDEQLTIKRFTPAAAELLGLVASDHGRSIAGMSRDLLRNGLEREARTVLEHLSMQSRELNVGDRWITRQVLPYRTEAKRIEGIVVTFMDVTALKSATERLAMRERQQAVIARTGLFALRGTNLQAFMDHVVREVQQTLQTDFCKILELQPGETRLLLRAGVGWQEGLVGSGLVPAGADSQAGYTLTSAEPVIVKDLSTEKRFSGPALLTDHGVVSGMSCVIRDGDHVYGVLGVHTDRPCAFSTEDANFLQAIASVIGSAVGRHRTRIRLAIERGVAQALAESGTPDVAFTKVLECFAKEFPISVGEIWWPTPDRRYLKRALFYVSPPSAKERFGKGFGECEFESGEQLVGRVFEEGRAIWCTDVADPDTFMRREVAADLGLVAGFGFPIRASRDVLGVVAIFSQDRLSADESLLNTLEALGRSMGEFMARWDVESRAKRLAAITASSHDAIIGYDFDGKITEWLVGAEQLFGYSAAEMVGNSIDTIILEERRAELRNIIARIRNGEVVEPYETTRVRKDGTVLDISIRSSPVFDAEGNLVGISSSDRDITKQKDVERRLVMADRQKDEFLAMLGHELRNPLATIRSAAELLKLSQGKPDRLARTQAVLERQSAHMAKLLDGLLDVSRIIRGTIQLDFETIDLATMCRDVCSDVIDRIPGRNLDIRTLLPPGPVWLNADPVRIAQIVDNLLTNAVKYTPDGGSITVTLSRTNGTAVLSIRDTGVGIAPDLLPDIFEVFRQAKQNLDRSYGGLGLGLALVKSLVQLHDGSVEAHSEGHDRGAEFIVRLPITAKPLAATESIRTATIGSLSILLIEDNEESAELMREVLGLSGHTVWIAARGRDGIEMARRLKPDLVLCDLGLPDGMSGFDVAHELRRHTATRSLKLVALSGYGRPEDKDRSLEAGFDAHMTKPVDVKTIGRVVGELVGR